MSITLICITVCSIFRHTATIALATFAVPENITTNASMTLWVLPLTCSIAVIYKTLKLPEIKLVVFVKETAMLFGSIIVFLAVSALVVLVAAYLFV